MSERAKSAVDVIYNLEKLVKKIDMRLNVIDGNIKLLNNKILKLQKAVNILSDTPKTTNENVSGMPSDAIIKSGKKSDLFVTGPIKTFGRIRTKERKPISDVEVFIYNENGDVIKTRRTDSEGYWEVRLPVGKFGVEYKRKGFKSVNLTIRLLDTMNEFEVS